MMMERVVGGCVVCVAGVALACDVWERHVDALLASACKTGHAPSRGQAIFASHTNIVKLRRWVQSVRLPQYEGLRCM